jgi:uncharacterized membrane protein YfcA
MSPPQRRLEAVRPDRHPGVIGGVLGAYVLSNIHADAARPFVLAYLLALGVFLFWRGWTHRNIVRKPRWWRR